MDRPSMLSRDFNGLDAAIGFQYAITAVLQ